MNHDVVNYYPRRVVHFDRIVPNNNDNRLNMDINANVNNNNNNNAPNVGVAHVAFQDEIQPVIDVAPNNNNQLQVADVPQQRSSTKGNFKPFFGGFFVIGPSLANFLICLLAIILMEIQFIYQLPTINKFSGKLIGILGLILYSFTAVFFIWTCISDPGVIPSDLTLQQYSLINPRSNDEIGFRHRFCNKCHKRRPPRSAHCSICGVCIRRRDMHLTFGSICIGQRNFTQFCFLNLFSVSLGFYLLIVNFVVGSRSNQIFESSFELIANIIYTALSIIFGIFLICWPQTGVLMIFYRVSLISQNKTVQEDFRAQQNNNDDDRDRLLFLFGFHHNFWRNVTRFFTPTPEARSIFRIRSEVLLGFTQTDWTEILTGARRIQRNYGLNNSVKIHKDLVTAYLQSGAQRVVISPRSYEYKIENDSSSNNIMTKLTGSTISLPYLEEGELLLFPGTKIPSIKKGTPISAESKSLKTKIQLFKNLKQIPKSIVDFRMNHPIPCSLSEGSIPRTEPTFADKNELIQLTRAKQIQQVIDLVIKRDREGLVELARRINLGALVGIFDLDPDNLQILDFHDGIPMLFANDENVRNVEDLRRRQEVMLTNRRLRATHHWIGLPQMVAAGLLQHNEYRLMRRLTGERLFD